MHRILLVDDEPLILKHTKDLLEWEALGCEVIGTASDGMAGIECIRSMHPDIVITDVVMPGMSGLQMIDAVREECACRFIVLSGYQEFEYVRHALRSGVVDYLLKPVTAADLHDAIVRMTSQTAEKSDEERYGSVVAKVIRCVDEHYGNAEFSLGWICSNELFMNETYVGRLFQRKTGMKFTAWVTDKRLKEARRLLESGQNIPVSEIAGRVGFVTSKYFIEVFRRHTDMSPGQYRQVWKEREKT
ncbi:MAG: response regulator [Clostridia bacterium]|nr:response regulator [Clostridia bacterium]MBQ2948009.1 response regulator [Clostridia bacterium]MBQ4610014.1 response regulator [Clostridia bacterium]MBQ6858940.1 response regulator [Clostridia bacterium]MBQ7052980.1 response regulator [Clostridia bacterium]